MSASSPFHNVQASVVRAFAKELKEESKTFLKRVSISTRFRLSFCPSTGDAVGLDVRTNTVLYALRRQACLFDIGRN